MFTRAVEWQFLKEHPMKGVKDLKHQKHQPAFLTLDQIDQLLGTCKHQHLYTFVVLAAHTGMRKGGIFNLKWDDADLKRTEITVRHTKNNESRTIPMNDLVVETLKRHPRHITSDLVLARDDGKAYKTVKGGFDAVLEKAGLPQIRIHDLRHSFASNLVIAGVPLNVVQELLGHKDINMTMVYAHLAPNAKRGAVDLLMQRGQEGEGEETIPTGNAASA